MFNRVDVISFSISLFTEHATMQKDDVILYLAQQCSTMYETFHGMYFTIKIGTIKKYFKTLKIKCLQIYE